MTSSRAAFDFNNHKFGVNRQAPSVFSISKKLGNVPCVSAYFNSEICSVWCHGLMNNTYPNTAHFRVFCKLTKPQVPIHSRFTII